MAWLESLEPIWEAFTPWLPLLGGTATVALTVGFITWTLMTKSDATSAVAWCLVIFFLPLLGPLLFFFFGYQHVNRPLRRKRKHKQRYRPPDSILLFRSNSVLRLGGWAHIGSRRNKATNCGVLEKDFKRPNKGLDICFREWLIAGDYGNTSGTCLPKQAAPQSWHALPMGKAVGSLWNAIPIAAIT